MLEKETESQIKFEVDKRTDIYASIREETKWKPIEILIAHEQTVFVDKPHQTNDFYPRPQWCDS